MEAKRPQKCSFKLIEQNEIEQKEFLKNKQKEKQLNRKNEKRN